jgi:outer membrane protein TolC
MIAVVLMAGSLAAADGKSAGPKKLQEYLTLAAKNNAGLKGAFSEWKAAAEAVPQAKALDDPRFTYGYFIEEVETRTGPQRQKFGISQKFPWLGKIEARTDAAAATAKAARKKYETKKLQLFYQVKSVYYEYAYLHIAIEKTKQNLELVGYFEQVALTRYAASAGSHPDVIRAQIELARLDDKVQTLEQMRKPIVAKLNAVLNRKPGKGLPWPARGEYEPVEINRNEMLARINMSNPEIGAMKHRIAAAQGKVTLAEKRFYPDITFGVDWIDTDDAAMAGQRDSGKDPVIAMFSVNIPLWADSYRAGVRQAKANLRKASSEKRQKQNDVRAGAAQVLFDIQDSRRKVKLYADVLLPKANEMLAATEATYKAGDIDFLSLINAQQTLLSFELILERAITDEMQSTAELEKFLGDS